MLTSESTKDAEMTSKQFEVNCADRFLCGLSITELI
jgi:hypothetical protein